MYLDLLRGRLDQKAQQFEVEYAVGRDLAPGQLETLLSSLQAWSSTTAGVLGTLDEQMRSIRDHRDAQQIEAEGQQAVVTAMLKELHESQRDRKATRALGGDVMEVDEPKAIGKKLK